MYIYVIRHGQTEWNITGKLLSTTDIPLNDTGIEQCNEAEEVVKNLSYDLVICSPLLRTKQTAQIVNSKGVEIIYDDRLIERNANSLEGADVNTFDYGAFWIKGKDNIQDVETIEECKERVASMLDEIKEKYSGKNILIVTHNGICRMINIYFNGMPKNGNLRKLGHSNAEIKMYEMK